MSYNTAEALLLTKVQSVTGFDTTNAVRANWKPLNHGKAACYAILRPSEDSSPVTWPSFGVYITEHLPVIEVWQRYKDETTTQTALYTCVQNIIAALQPANRLSDTTGSIINATVISVTVPQEMWTKGSGPAWLRQDITVSIKEQTLVSAFTG